MFSPLNKNRDITFSAGVGASHRGHQHPDRPRNTVFLLVNLDIHFGVKKSYHLFETGVPQNLYSALPFSPLNCEGKDADFRGFSNTSDHFGGLSGSNSRARPF